jgi:hypothetical protein
MHIPQFLYALLFAPYVEVIVPPLPELSFSAPFEPSRRLLLQDLQGDCQRRFARLSDKKVNVLRHQNISGNDKLVSPTHLLKLPLEDPVRRLVAQ